MDNAIVARAGWTTRPGRVRLGTLNNLRWLAVAGQSFALILVRFGFGFRLPLLLCAGVIAVSAALNIILSLRFRAARRVAGREATLLLAYDILQLAALLYLTGGIENPFALLFVAPVVISAATLDLLNTVLLGVLAFAAVSLLARYHMELPWSGTDFHLPRIYRMGIWVSLNLSIGFTSIYAWRIAGEFARMSAALSATQLALSRERRLAALGALATAAAHELGTPLGTIALVARELEREAPFDATHADDFRLLRAEAERCRAILTQLAKPEDSVLAATERVPLGALLDDIATRHRGFDVEISIALPKGPAPKVWRAPELLHGLGNLIENAADFANGHVRLGAEWNEKFLSVEVADDGPGFAPEILERIGEPYLTSRPLWSRMRRGFKALDKVPDQAMLEESDSGHEGMGLGYFIAKTLIEQTGGRITARNSPGGGAVVEARWPRRAIDGEAPPDWR